ncbi:Uncharacterised protein g5077 [Pycnogonum litorale]
MCTRSSKQLPNNVYSCTEYLLLTVLLLVTSVELLQNGNVSDVTESTKKYGGNLFDATEIYSKPIDSTDVNTTRKTNDESLTAGSSKVNGSGVVDEIAIKTNADVSTTYGTSNNSDVATKSESGVTESTKDSNFETTDSLPINSTDVNIVNTDDRKTKEDVSTTVKSISETNESNDSDRKGTMSSPLRQDQNGETTTTIEENRNVNDYVRIARRDVEKLQNESFDSLLLNSSTLALNVDANYLIESMMVELTNVLNATGNLLVSISDNATESATMKALSKLNMTVKEVIDYFEKYDEILQENPEVMSTSRDAYDVIKNLYAIMKDIENTTVVALNGGQYPSLNDTNNWKLLMDNINSDFKVNSTKFIPVSELMKEIVEKYDAMNADASNITLLGDRVLHLCSKNATSDDAEIALNELDYLIDKVEKKVNESVESVENLYDFVSKVTPNDVLVDYKRAIESYLEILVNVCKPVMTEISITKHDKQETTESSMTKETTEAQVTERTTGAQVTERTTGALVTERTTDALMTEISITKHDKQETTESSMTKETTEAQVTGRTTGALVTERTTDALMTEISITKHDKQETTESSMTKETTEAQVTERTTGALVTERTTGAQVTERTTGAQVTERTTGALVTERTTDALMTELSITKHDKQETTENSMTKETTEAQVTKETTEAQVTERTMGAQVTERTTGALVTERATGALVTERTTEHDKQETTELSLKETATALEEQNPDVFLKTTQVNASVEVDKAIEDVMADINEINKKLSVLKELQSADATQEQILQATKDVDVAVDKGLHDYTSYQNIFRNYKEYTNIPNSLVEHMESIGNQLKKLKDTSSKAVSDGRGISDGNILAANAEMDKALSDYKEVSSSYVSFTEWVSRVSTSYTDMNSATIELRSTGTDVYRMCNDPDSLQSDIDSSLQGLNAITKKALDRTDRTIRDVIDFRKVLGEEAQVDPLHSHKRNVVSFSDSVIRSCDNRVTRPSTYSTTVVTDITTTEEVNRAIRDPKWMSDDLMKTVMAPSLASMFFLLILGLVCSRVNVNMKTITRGMKKGVAKLRRR